MIGLIDMTGCEAPYQSIGKPAMGHSRQAKDTKQINKNNSFDWFIQNINTIALVEPAWLADRGI
jgi:hypothetical protein